LDIGGIETVVALCMRGEAGLGGGRRERLHDCGLKIADGDGTRTPTSLASSRRW
jgi:hypothetical protein